MHIGDKTIVGYKPAREHDLGVRPDLRSTRQNCIVSQDDEGFYKAEFHGDEIGWIYWKLENQETGETGQDGPAEEESPRKVIFAQYQGSEIELGSAPIGVPRVLGSWATSFAAASLPGNKIAPIVSKLGGVDNSFQKKNIKLGVFGSNKKDIRPAAGCPLPGGVPGVVVQTVNPDQEEMLFFTVGNPIVDHSSTGLSTRVFSVNSEGNIDASKQEAAALDSLLRVENNENNEKILTINAQESGVDTTGFAAISIKSDTVESRDTVSYLSHEKNGPLTGIISGKETATNEENKLVGPVAITSNALFHLSKSANKIGPLAFTDTLFPLTSDEETTIAECKLSFDGNKWRWWVAIENGGQQFARIRWNFDIEDFSEGELVTVTGIPTAVKIWIDYTKSRGITASTAGTGTIYAVTLITQEHTRNGQVRPLFRATESVSDQGILISHFFTKSRETNSYHLMQDISVLGQRPWDATELSKIKTEIAGEELENVMRVRIPSQWDTENISEDYAWLEAIDFSRGLDYFGAPILPQPENSSSFNLSGIMVSAEKFGAATIARYKIR